MSRQRKPLSRGKRAAAIVLCAAVLLGALLPVAMNVYIIMYAKPYIISEEDAAGRSADCVLVLGARVMPDGTMSHMLEDRSACGLRLYQAGAGKKLLLSGDHGTYGYDEVGAMRDYATSNGAPKPDVFTDHAGFSTYESMYRARDVFSVKTAVVVTQRYHLYRAVYLARKLGIDAVGVEADAREYGSPLYNNGREFLARVKAFAMVIFKPEPTFLGEVIPISGSGELTV